MNSSLKKMLMALLMVAFVTMLAACGTAEESSAGEAEVDEPATEETETEGTEEDAAEATEPEEVREVSVAVVQDYPPFEYVVDGDLVGFDIDIIEAIAENQGLEISWEIMRFDGIIPALQANQVDAAVSAITIREDRAEVVDFTAPYFESGLSLVVPVDSEINSVEDLEGAQLVAKQGTSGLEKAREFAEEYNGDVTVLQEDATMYMEIISGNGDAMINDYPSVAYKIALDGDDSDVRIIGDRLTGEDYGIAVSKGAEGLLEIFDAGLAEIMENGTYDDIYNTYFAE
ncbi:glutamine-binding periplasmic protein fused to glutamine permease [Halalkalibacter wakoensis JCM 9140]|uniref:Glutamine-binding periplasmic protein fused to glutamine permease n=1 Tax=Halalkalibacter wakoensis JCM 9140 TaxID=1236970 RepID=W4Q965_9BACI|nr:transporter substrate-binding domain-containing protein [Halalkalibacter wakoensis]GAE28540.1 glutamine-binding periplasmic protein fused to glutamine permease [Halalkalibacter wakoensis JCM 9140]